MLSQDLPPLSSFCLGEGEDGAANDLRWSFLQFVTSWFLHGMRAEHPWDGTYEHTKSFLAFTWHSLWLRKWKYKRETSHHVPWIFLHELAAAGYVGGTLPEKDGYVVSKGLHQWFNCKGFSCVTEEIALTSISPKREATGTFMTQDFLPPEVCLLYSS